MEELEFDQDALVKLFADATTRQGAALRRAVSETTLRALQGRELALHNVCGTLTAVTEAASAGAARNPGAAVDIAALLGEAVAGMDEALITAVEAHHKALQQFVDRGFDFGETRLKRALDEIETLETAFIESVTGVAQVAAGPLQGPWAHVIASMRLHGTGTGAQAAFVVDRLMAQARSALRASREQGLRTTQALLDGYSTLVSGVLIGMLEGMHHRVAGMARPPAQDPAPEPETVAAAPARRHKG